MSVINPDSPDFEDYPCEMSEEEVWAALALLEITEADLDDIPPVATLPVANPEGH